jgi:hypothetical protein
MAQPKKKIAKLVLQGISVLGILFGFFCFFFAIDFIFSIQKDNLFDLCISLLLSAWMLVLGAFFMYPSYKMLRGRSFLVIKSMAALLALSAFSLVERLIEFINTLINRELSILEQTAVDSSSFLLAVVVFVLVYKICTKLLGKLRIAAYGLEEISEAQHSTE